MKIYEYIKKKILECELEDIKDFDFTQLEDTEIFNAIKSSLELGVNWDSFGPVSTRLLSTTVHMDMLEDGKVYPAIRFFVSVNHDGITGGGMVYVDPFRCFRVDDHCAYERIAKKNVSKALRDFYIEKFGEIYKEKCNEYFETVKQLKIKRAQAEAGEKIKQAEEEFEENIFDF